MVVLGLSCDISQPPPCFRAHTYWLTQIPALPRPCSGLLGHSVSTAHCPGKYEDDCSEDTRTPDSLLSSNVAITWSRMHTQEYACDLCPSSSGRCSSRKTNVATATRGCRCQSNPTDFYFFWGHNSYLTTQG